MGQTCVNWLHVQSTLGQIHKEPGVACCPGERNRGQTVLGRISSDGDALIPFEFGPHEYIIYSKNLK